MPTILLDENIEGYADYLSRFLFSPEWKDVSTQLGVSLQVFSGVGLTKGATDEQVWELCQQQRLYLLTENRNKDDPDSLEHLIRTRTLPTSLPVFTISAMDRLRTERKYVESLVAKLLEYLLEPDNLLGTGRLYLP